jgi:hypothetical protein
MKCWLVFYPHESKRKLGFFGSSKSIFGTKKNRSGNNYVVVFWVARIKEDKEKKFFQSES